MSQKTDWTMDEIKAQAAKDFKAYQEISKENPDLEGFASGDMEKFLKGHEDNNEEY